MSKTTFFFPDMTGKIEFVNLHLSIFTTDKTCDFAQPRCYLFYPATLPGNICESWPIYAI
ncbi:MAG: hypothetical protein DSY90_13495 [Deltaproteobacteria bacterium]|nr:MAG: hypothetical protein DSY90_13495 [Deltaproteobacteria bacterium]